MLSKQDYLLDWGVNFVDNFNFTDEKKKKSKKQSKSINKKTLSLDSDEEPNDVEDKTSPKTKTITITETDIQTRKTTIFPIKQEPSKNYIKPNTLNKVAIIKRRNPKRGKNKPLTSLDDIQQQYRNKPQKDKILTENQAAWKHTITVAKTILSTQKEGVIDDNGETDIDEDPDSIVPVKINENVLRENEYKRSDSHKVKTQKLSSKYSEDQIRKILTPKQFPHLREFIGEDRNKEEEIVGFREPIRSKIEHLGGMGKYIVLDPSNDDHSKYGFIYLDDETKVSNNHFYSFRPNRYVKPHAIREICNKTQKMLEKKAQLEKDNKNKSPSVQSNKNTGSSAIDSSNPETPISLDLKSLDLPDPDEGFHLNTHQLHFRGCWDAQRNIPKISSGTGKVGDFYIVSVSSSDSTEIDGENQWMIGDVICFDHNKNVWNKF